MLKKFKNQLIFASLIVATVPLLIMGVFNHLSSSSELREGLLIRYNNIVRLEKNRIEAFLSGVKEDVLVMRDSPTLHNMLSASGDEYNRQRALLEKEFLSLSKNKKIYYQVRYLDEKGMEVVRVDSDGTKPAIISRNKLQEKSGRYYFKNTIKLDRGEIFVSPLDLNREMGQIEKPHNPVIRYATPVFHGRAKRGIMIINVFANKFLDPIKKLNTIDEYYLLFSNEGYYFIHPHSVNEWGDPVNLNTKQNVSKDFPDKIASILTGSGIESIGYDDNILAQSIFYPDDKNKKAFWKLVRVGKKEIVFAPLNRLFWIWIILMFIALALAVLIAVIMSRKITKPLIHLTHAAESIGQGKPDTPIKIDGTIEIKTLGRTIQTLKESQETAIRYLKKQSEE